MTDPGRASELTTSFYSMIGQRSGDTPWSAMAA